MITIFGLQIGWLVAGAVVIEMVFVWPGVGRLIVDSIIRSDYPVVQGSPAHPRSYRDPR